MCKNLKEIQSRDGERRFLCDARGTAYCTMSRLLYPEFAIYDPKSCKNYEAEK